MGLASNLIALGIPWTVANKLSEYIGDGFSNASGDIQIKTATSDGSDSAAAYFTGGGGASTTRGALITAYGNENASAGVLSLASGGIAGSSVQVDAANSTGTIQFYINGTEKVRFTTDSLFRVRDSSLESTGAGSAALGSNSPAVTNSAPYKWLKIITQDGSFAYIPAWK